MGWPWHDCMEKEKEMRRGAAPHPATLATTAENNPRGNTDISAAAAFISQDALAFNYSSN